MFLFFVDRGSPRLCLSTWHHLDQLTWPDTPDVISLWPGFDQGAWSIEQTASPGLSDFALDLTSPSNFATLGPITAIFFDEGEQHA